VTPKRHAELIPSGKFYKGRSQENRNTFLVHVHADIFGADHKGRSSSGAVELALKTLLQKGRPFIMCGFWPDFTYPTTAVTWRLATPSKFRSRIPLNHGKGIFGERRTAFVGPREWLRGVGTEEGIDRGYWRSG
jgi:hypothetical protein